MIVPHRIRPSGTRPTRRRRGLIVESLEGRAMLDAGGHFDLSFGGAVGSSRTGSVSLPGVVSSLSSVDQRIAVAPGGDIIDATFSQGFASATSMEPATLTLFRLSPVGVVDTSFQQHPLIIPGTFSSSLNALTSTAALRGMVVQPDGKVLVLADASAEANGQGTAAQLLVLRYNIDGSLDTTFGGSKTGMVRIGFTGATSSTAGGIALQADGKIVVDGTSTTTSGDQFGVVRLDADGSVDSTFGTAGQVVSTFSMATTTAGKTASAGSALLIQADGKIVVGGSTTEFAAARLNPDGSFDATFGLGGKVALTNSGTGGNSDASTIPNSAGLTSIALGPDGSLVLAGQGLAFYPISVAELPSTGLIRLTSTGQLDTSFHSGTSNYPGAVAESVVVQPNGKVVLATGGGISRYTTTGALDPSFGISQLNGAFPPQLVNASLAVLGNGKILAAGSDNSFEVSRLLAGATSGDYQNDGQANPTVSIPSAAAFAIRSSTGGPDQVIPFGIPGASQSIPTPGDYDGSGKTELSVYIPALGEFFYRPSNGGADVGIPFGFAGVGQTIPAPGDYDGDGVTEIAAYLPSLGAFAIRPSTGGPDQIIPFGIAGAGQSIPAPGDYDGSGRTELAVYLPSLGLYGYRPANGGPDVLTRFGIPGAGQSIPTPGVYDGSGRTAISVYIPSLARLFYRPPLGGADVAIPFGLAGAGQTIPAPGDYDGDGKTDVAAYLPSLGVFAYRPSSGGPDFFESFGYAGVGGTIPVDSLAGPIAEAMAPASSSSTLFARSIDLDILPATDEAGPSVKSKAKKAGTTTA